MSGLTRLQELVPADLRGRTTGTLLSVNAFGLSIGATLAGSAASTPTLMAGQTACLLLLATGWPFLHRAEARRRAQGC